MSNLCQNVELGTPLFSYFFVKFYSRHKGRKIYFENKYFDLVNFESVDLGGKLVLNFNSIVMGFIVGTSKSQQNPDNIQYEHVFHAYLIVVIKFVLKIVSIS